MSKELTIDNTLDSHLKPLKIDDKLTGIEISEDNIVFENTVSINKQLSLGGSVKFQQEDPTIDFGNSQSLTIDTSQSLYRFNGAILEVFGLLFSETENTDAMINILADGTGDSKVVFYSDVAAKFNVGNDATDHNLTIATGSTLDSGQLLKMDNTGATTLNCTDGNTDLKLTSSADTGDFFSITTTTHGATTVATVDDDASAANLTLDVDGDITLDAGSASGRIYIKKAGDEFARISGKNSLSTLTLYEAGGASSDDYFLIQTDTAGETFIRTVDAAGAAGHLNIEPDGHVEFDGCGVGFDLVTPTYDATDTDVDFRTGNKQFVTFGSGNITDLNLVLPATSGNFVVLLKQDGTGSRTITNYKAGLFGTTPADVKFAGGSNPTLTTDANHVDILSFFWDADNAICYGVATLDFQF